MGHAKAPVAQTLLSYTMRVGIVIQNLIKYEQPTDWNNKTLL
jgi:hypothetical protein